MTTKEQVIQAAKEAGGYLGELPLCDAWLFMQDSQLEALYNIAYKAGEKAMQEKAAKAAEAWPFSSYQQIAATIRALEVK